LFSSHTIVLPAFDHAADGRSVVALLPYDEPQSGTREPRDRYRELLRSVAPYSPPPAELIPTERGDDRRSLSLDKGDDVTAVGAADHVAFPMTRYGPVFGRTSCCSGSELRVDALPAGKLDGIEAQRLGGI
jgi:hypothetical protein